MCDTGGIDDYVAAVGRRLRGSRRMRADMLAEIRGALLDEAEAAEHLGVPGVEAQRQAVARFGPAEEIAAGLQDVLACVHARRTAWGLLVVVGVRHLVTVVSASLGQWDRWGNGAPGTGYALLARSLDGFVLACLALSAAAVILFGRAVRLRGLRRGEARAVAVGAPVVLAVTVAGGLLLTALTPAGSTALDAVLPGTVLWLVPFAVVLRSAWRCWQAAAHRPAPAPTT